MAPHDFVIGEQAGEGNSIAVCKIQNLPEFRGREKSPLYPAADPSSFQIFLPVAFVTRFNYTRF
jgi:hypothetical protein